MARSSSCTSRNAPTSVAWRRRCAGVRRQGRPVSTRTTPVPMSGQERRAAALLETVRRLDRHGIRARRHRPASPVARRRLHVTDRHAAERCDEDAPPRERQESGRKRKRAKEASDDERPRPSSTASGGRRRVSRASDSRSATRSSSRGATWSRSRACPRSSSSSWSSRSCSCCCSSFITRISSRGSPGWRRPVPDAGTSSRTPCSVHEHGDRPGRGLQDPRDRSLPLAADGEIGSRGRSDDLRRDQERSPAHDRDRGRYWWGSASRTDSSTPSCMYALVLAVGFTFREPRRASGCRSKQVEAVQRPASRGTSRWCSSSSRSCRSPAWRPSSNRSPGRTGHGLVQPGPVPRERAAGHHRLRHEAARRYVRGARRQVRALDRGR